MGDRTKSGSSRRNTNVAIMQIAAQCAPRDCFTSLGSNVPPDVEDVISTYRKLKAVIEEDACVLSG